MEGFLQVASIFTASVLIIFAQHHWGEGKKKLALHSFVCGLLFFFLGLRMSEYAVFCVGAEFSLLFFNKWIKL
jgi:hypothetical protein